MLANKQHGFSGLYLLIAVVLLGFSSCKKDSETLPEKESYSFFVAGHTYGSPGTDNKGLHPPFEDKFDYINKRGIQLGILTGDIVNESTIKNWNEVDSVLKELEAKVHFAPGNHDVENRELYESRYGTTYYDFTYEDDLYIILDPNIDNWNILGVQLEYLKNLLESKSELHQHVFVFFHQLLWWDNNNKYKNFRPNSVEGRADTINFWTEIEPLFRKLENNVIMFSGDLGAADWSDNFMYDHYDNITIVSSGMGGYDGDNFIIVNVEKNSLISFEIIPLYENVKSQNISPHIVYQFDSQHKHKDE